MYQGASAFETAIFGSSRPQRFRSSGGSHETAHRAPRHDAQGRDSGELGSDTRRHDACLSARQAGARQVGARPAGAQQAGAQLTHQPPLDLPPSITGLRAHDQTDTLQHRLTEMALASMVRPEQRAHVTVCTFQIKRLLQLSFRKQIKRHELFGSYARGTMLPRSIDRHACVDYLIQFTDRRITADDYLDLLASFAEIHFPTSLFRMTRTGVQVDMGEDVVFNLVPAIIHDGSSLGIPAPSGTGATSQWQEAAPLSLKERIAKQDAKFGHNILPVIRILKWWNTSVGEPFQGIQLESRIAEHKFRSSSVLSFLLFDAIGGLRADWTAPKADRNALRDLQAAARQADDAERKGRFAEALTIMNKVLPAPLHLGS